MRLGDPVGVWPESGAPCGADAVEAPYAAFIKKRVLGKSGDGAGTETPATWLIKNCVLAEGGEIGSANGAKPGSNREPEDVIWPEWIGDPVGIWPAVLDRTLAPGVYLPRPPLAVAAPKAASPARNECVGNIVDLSFSCDAILPQPMVISTH